jgi:hypothetical protein
VESQNSQYAYAVNEENRTMLRARCAGVKVEGNPELVEGNCGVEGNREVEGNRPSTRFYTAFQLFRPAQQLPLPKPYAHDSG